MRLSLAGKSTINRLEYCPETIIDQAKSRYHKNAGSFSIVFILEQI